MACHDGEGHRDGMKAVDSVLSYGSSGLERPGHAFVMRAPGDPITELATQASEAHGWGARSLPAQHVSAVVVASWHQPRRPSPAQALMATPTSRAMALRMCCGCRATTSPRSLPACKISTSTSSWSQRHPNCSPVFRRQCSVVGDAHASVDHMYGCSLRAPAWVRVLPKYQGSSGDDVSPEHIAALEDQLRATPPFEAAPSEYQAAVTETGDVVAELVPGLTWQFNENSWRGCGGNYLHTHADQPQNHDVVISNADGVELEFGTAKAAVLSATSDCRLAEAGMASTTTVSHP
jgi:hypothetical protein